MTDWSEGRRYQYTRDWELGNSVIPQFPAVEIHREVEVVLQEVAY